MKKIIFLLLVVLCFTGKAQNPVCTQTAYPYCIPFQNTDLLQLYNLHAITNGTSSASTATLNAIKKGIDTIAQNTRFNVSVLKMTKTTAQLWSSYVYGVSSGVIDGVRSISFIPSATMTGSINGIPVDGTYYKPLDVISISATPPAGVLNGITYSILTGSVLVNYTQ